MDMDKGFSLGLGTLTHSTHIVAPHSLSAHPLITLDCALVSPGVSIEVLSRPYSWGASPRYPIPEVEGSSVEPRTMPHNWRGWSEGLRVEFGWPAFSQPDIGIVSVQCVLNLGSRESLENRLDRCTSILTPAGASPHSSVWWGNGQTGFSLVFSDKNKIILNSITYRYDSSVSPWPCRVERWHLRTSPASWDMIQHCTWL